MVAVIDKDQAKFLDVDSDHFSISLTISSKEKALEDNSLECMYFKEPFLSVSPSSGSTLQLSDNNKNSSQLSETGILRLMNYCYTIRELSLSYSLLTEKLIMALSNAQSIPLETLRVEAYEEAKPKSKISHEVWITFANHYPAINLILLTYLTDSEDYEELIESYVPLTHLYFAEGVPFCVIDQVGEKCPRLQELVIGAYGPSTIDETLLSAAKGCPKLSAIGLGDCELSCSAFIKFVNMCCERLKNLYVLDTSLIENSEYTVMEVVEKVSSLLGKPWQPNYVPYW